MLTLGAYPCIKFITMQNLATMVCLEFFIGLGDILLISIIGLATDLLQESNSGWGYENCSGG